MNLKPQDVVVALKLFGYPNGRPSMSIVASDLGLSPSEVHGAIQRLRSSKLLHGSALQDKPNISGLVEFLVHGLKYAFPAEHGEVTRGKVIPGALGLRHSIKACLTRRCVIPRCTNF